MNILGGLIAVAAALGAIVTVVGWFGLVAWFVSKYRLSDRAGFTILFGIPFLTFIFLIGAISPTNASEYKPEVMRMLSYHESMSEYTRDKGKVDKNVH